MKANKRRNFSGVFRALDLGGGAWCLSQALPRPIEVHVQMSPAHPPPGLGASDLQDFGIEWRPDSALLTMLAGDRVTSVEAASAIVHEPLSHLYETLPLARFDAKARRFWRRVFILIRLPGGRHLLKLWARR